MTEIQNIPYFDGHCDTIWRCMKREAVPDYGATEDERRAYFFRLRRPAGKQGHVDLLRGQHYRKRAQFLPCTTMYARCPKYRMDETS